MRHENKKNHQKIWGKLSIALLAFIIFIIISSIFLKRELKSDKAILKKSEIINEDHDSNTKSIEINVAGALSRNKIPLLSNLANEVKYVKLKTPVKYYLKKIFSLNIYKYKIYVADNSMLLVFDMKGNFIMQIGRQGRGPGEYISIRNFTIDETAQYIYIYGGTTGNVLKYSLDGKFKGVGFTYHYADQIDFICNKFIFSGIGLGNTKNMPSDITQYAIVDSNGISLEKKLLPIYRIKDFRNKHLGIPGNFKNTRYNNSLLLYSYGEDTIYNVGADNKIIPKYFLNFGKHSLSIDQRYVNLKVDDRGQHIIALSSPFETGNHLLLKFALRGFPYILDYNKNKKESSTFKYTGNERINFLKGKTRISGFGFKNNIDGGVDFFPEWSIMHNSKQLLVTALLPYNLKLELTEDHFRQAKCSQPDKKQELMTFVHNLKEIDNYVLMIISAK